MDPALDELKAISRSGRQVIAEMEERERARTGIASLKVRFNRVFGYYIEISKAESAPGAGDYLRKQTIAGGERFTTPALKEYEEKVLGADERILERETRDLRGPAIQRGRRGGAIQDTARALATLDVLAGARRNRSDRQLHQAALHEGDEFVVADGRHPVVERFADAFVPNDIDLNGTSRQLVVLTGPNMGGKSTYLRQTALIPLMAQIGSFVPARHAKLRSSIASSRASERRTISPADSPRSWWRCRRPPTSCTPRRREASSCSMRSAAARRRSTG